MENKKNRIDYLIKYCIETIFTVIKNKPSEDFFNDAVNSVSKEFNLSIKKASSCLKPVYWYLCLKANVISSIDNKWILNSNKLKSKNNNFDQLTKNILNKYRNDLKYRRFNIKDANDIYIREAGGIIQRGGIVAFPTETVYGLGADAFNSDACEKVFRVKKRPYFNPLIVHVANLYDLKKVCEVNELALLLINEFWPGPLTLILKKNKKLPDIVTAGLPTVAVRMPSHQIALNLIKYANTPIAAPSANLFSYISPTLAEHVMEQLGDAVDLILDDGQCPVGIESTIIDLTTNKPVLRRAGGLPIEKIEKIIGEVEKRSMPLQNKPNFPGQFKNHYSPNTKLKIVKNIKEVKKSKKSGFLAFHSIPKDIKFKSTEVLSSNKDFDEAAVNLFACLHRLDKAKVECIYVETIPETGLGRAIMDRLYKAMGGTK